MQRSAVVTGSFVFVPDSRTLTQEDERIGDSPRYAFSPSGVDGVPTGHGPWSVVCEPNVSKQNEKKKSPHKAPEVKRGVFRLALPRFHDSPCA